MLRDRLLPLFVIWLLAMLACGLAAAAQPDRAPRPRIALDPAVCDQIAVYSPDPGVAYRPGVDVDGAHLAPADLPGTASPRLPRAFPIGVDFYVGGAGDPAGTGFRGSRTGQPGNEPSPSILLSPEGQVGEIAVVQGPGGMRLFFNGQPLTDPAEAQIRDACADWKGRRHG